MKEVYVVLKNADFTEGRGPMHFHRVYESMKAAEQYIMRQDGIFGSKQSLSGKDYTYSDGTIVRSYNGYQVLTAKLYTIDAVALEQHRTALEEKIAKLQEELDSTY